jgi:hypothetical protein
MPGWFSLTRVRRIRGVIPLSMTYSLSPRLVSVPTSLWSTVSSVNALLSWQGSCFSVVVERVWVLYVLFDDEPSLGSLGSSPWWPPLPPDNGLEDLWGTGVVALAIIGLSVTDIQISPPRTTRSWSCILVMLTRTFWLWVTAIDRSFVMHSILDCLQMSAWCILSRTFWVASHSL